MTIPKIYNKNRSSLFLLEIILMVLLVNCSQYRIPTPDGSISNPSPPSLQGFMFSFTNNMIYVQVERSSSIKSNIVEVKIDNETEFFTEDGGFVAKESLKKDQKVKIWFTKESEKKNSQPPVAAAIVVEIRYS